MDTAFFAVDKDGHVAFFSTGEAGAEPVEAALENPYEILKQLAGVLPRGEAMHDLTGRILPGPLGRQGKH